ncbi:hypothetical protein [Shimazuella alba]|jgi:hypothetical protein|uniref:Uncharacterized protein n=1 Tax=Shimazuella alba TaxID=2690964 RepID=A0A6I4VXQ3_9BACL|nr:hypothetical protein [Shimazuella alba]MXQ54656.1 hypothetical protein [Shimazuella alba]
MSKQITYMPIADVLNSGSVPLKEAADTLRAYGEGPREFAIYLIDWRVDNRPLTTTDQLLLEKARKISL